uniref:High mobility group B2 n=1 Tax=Ipomoea batatas TaxID=4120 RepID=A0A0F6NGD0_IPOBA|nr:high mobility group B2 [Ipomoea batatas]
MQAGGMVLLATWKHVMGIRIIVVVTNVLGGRAGEGGFFPPFPHAIYGSPRGIYYLALQGGPCWVTLDSMCPVLLGSEPNSGLRERVESESSIHYLEFDLSSDTIVLEFNQYSPGSRWRRTSVRRKDHREEGNETDGFYGGIQKVESSEVISTWKRLWPAEVLE